MWGKPIHCQQSRRDVGEGHAVSGPKFMSWAMWCCLLILTLQSGVCRPRSPQASPLAQVPESQKDVGENHAVSGLKFRILRRFLDLGYAVLLSDVDIVTVQARPRRGMLLGPILSSCPVGLVSCWGWGGFGPGTRSGMQHFTAEPLASKLLSRGLA